MLKLIVNWLKTSDPSRKFRSELDLMFWGATHSKLIRKYFQRRIFYVYNCEVSHTAKIHPTVRFGHPTGVIIGSNVTIGAGSVIYQQVTLGSNFKKGDNQMPVIGERCVIAAGAKVIGKVSIGDGSIVGANAVVTKDVPSSTVVIGANRVLS
ncbi:TPA: serine acetyltransferase [Vibrio vulnificus]|uniref:serine acetyltransferase n=1 Tax=Vibrio vulnificus TaxID=672 RepID=UPI0019D4C18B|nr:serine acetyltransferase [Vibrio vulnificus]EGQ7964062.1 serine acetyltransferase [Vibrio vulnificus]EHU4914939.1 serine acetyltransferase [Vibrio vulnificus]ELR8703402.1 serine acetyltransferase [Vibrio vulnificus]ELR8771646.1 serine acetyltransferase [Vibrio vulnificus]MBN8091277.1 serine acetyltransferase [Vibrio vulnificus]